MKITVIKNKPTKLQAFFLRPLTLKQRMQVKLSVLMFKIKTRSERPKFDEVGCDDLLVGMDNRELAEELKEAWQIINVLNMCEMDRGESYPRANLWLKRWEALTKSSPNESQNETRK
jgi:hypothetical protein